MHGGSQPTKTRPCASGEVKPTAGARMSMRVSVNESRSARERRILTSSLCGAWWCRMLVAGPAKVPLLRAVTCGIVSQEVGAGVVWCKDATCMVQLNQPVSEHAHRLRYVSEAVRTIGIQCCKWQRLHGPTTLAMLQILDRCAAAMLSLAPQRHLDIKRHAVSHCTSQLYS